MYLHVEWDGPTLCFVVCDERPPSTHGDPFVSGNALLRQHQNARKALRDKETHSLSELVIAYEQRLAKTRKSLRSKREKLQAQQAGGAPEAPAAIVERPKDCPPGAAFGAPLSALLPCRYLLLLPPASLNSCWSVP